MTIITTILYLDITNHILLDPANTRIRLSIHPVKQQIQPLIDHPFTFVNNKITYHFQTLSLLLYYF